MAGIPRHFLHLSKKSISTCFLKFSNYVPTEIRLLSSLQCYHKPFACCTLPPYVLQNRCSSTTLHGSTRLQHSVPTAEQEKGSADNSDDQKAKRDASWRTMKYALIAIGSSFGLFGSYLVFTLGTPARDENGKKIRDEFSHLPAFKQWLYRMRKEVEYYNKMIVEPSHKKLLPDPLTYPYVQPPYTLVLELTDLLVHPDWTYQTGWRFKKRPGVDHFLEEVGAMFEIVIYTAEQGMTVFPILDALDPKGFIMYRLVRDATEFIDGHHVKNLDCLNRELKKVIVVDWNPRSVQLHRFNTLIIPRWKGSDDDTTLIELADFLRREYFVNELSKLRIKGVANYINDYFIWVGSAMAKEVTECKAIALHNVEDVREVLEYYAQFENPIEAYRENQRKVLEQDEEREKIKQERKQNPTLIQRFSKSFAQ